MPKEKVYDGRELWIAYHGWGRAATNRMLMEYCQTKYGQSSQMGGIYSMRKWAFEHPEEAFPHWKDWHFDRNPDKPEPSFMDFLRVLRGWANHDNVAGEKKLRNFCIKYGLPVEYKVKEKDVIQVARRDSLLFQALLIVEKVDGDRVDAFLVNSDGSRTEHTFNIKEVGVIGEAIFGRRQGFFKPEELTILPRLIHLARENETPFKGIERAIEGIDEGFRFIYGKKGGAYEPTSYFYVDIDEGISSEIKRLKESISNPEVEPV